MLNRERIAGQHVAHTTQAMEENVVETHAAQPSRWSRVALVIGGLSFVAMYVQQQIFAAQTGRLPQISELSTSITAWTNGALFSLAIILIAVGLVGIGAWMRQRAPKLSIAAMIFATLAFVGHAVNFVLLLSVTGAPTYIGLLAGLGVVSSLLSTTLLGIAALRTRAFSRAINWTLVSVGLVTFPVILLTIPLEAVLPPYVISDLPFPVWGAIFAGIGYALLRTERNVLVLAAGAITSAVVQRTDPIQSLYFIGVISSALVGSTVAARRPTNPVGWILLCSAASYAAMAALTAYIHYGPPEARGWAWLPGVLMIPGLMLVLTWLPLVFPTGRLLGPRWRWVWWGTGAIALLNMCYWAIRSGDIERFPGVPNPIGWIALQPLVGLLDTAVMWGIIGTIFVSGVSVWMRFRRSAGEERQQIKWLVCAVGAWSGTALFSLFVAWFYPDEIWQIELALALLFAAIPITVGNAVLRYRLYDIDLLINRTLVYGALTATIVAIYVLVVGYLGALFNARGNVSISLIATGLVAVLFAPLRDRLQRGVNRLLYGERDEPYTALTRLGQRLEATLAPDAVLPTIVRTVAEALKLPYVAITLHTPDRPFAAQRVIVAEHGQAPQYPSSLRMLPLFYGGETVGELQLAPRRPNEPLSGADDRLLADLARQAGAAVQAVQLTAALQAGLDDVRRSRERLVTAQEEERRRIQRDLHDGLGPVLASMRLRLEACLARAHDEAPDLAHDLERLHALVGQATTDIRRLVYNLRPPALDQLGLVPALRQHVHRWERETGVAVQLDAALNAPLPAAVDVTLFRIVHKALVNVHKHARATEVKLDLAQHNAGVTLLVQDNGVGGAATNAGTGLESMRERAELVGGTLAMESASGAGTKLAVQLPLRGEHHD